jgi:hypothetical protein
MKVRIGTFNSENLFAPFKFKGVEAIYTPRIGADCQGRLNGGTRHSLYTLLQKYEAQHERPGFMAPLKFGMRHVIRR